VRVDRKAATREQIVGATEALICEGGLAAVTTQSVARKGGFAEGTIYRHFESRDELIVSTMRERLAGDFEDATRALLSRAGKGDIVENLSRFVTTILPIYTTLAPVIGMLAADPALAARNAQSMCASGKSPRTFSERIATYFCEEQRLGRVAGDIDPVVAADLLVGLCFHRGLIRHLFHEDPAEISDRELPAALATIVGRGVRVQCADPSAARP
jgi:AcrR family transcriptional regulator